MLELLQGDWIEQLRTLPDASVHCCVTSPPYWGLRDYGVPGQLGLEKTPEEYVAKLVEGFREVRRVLRDDGTLWLNLGDSYNSIGHKKSNSGYGTTTLAGGIAQEHTPLHRENTDPNLKHKDLVGIPWRVAFALQADGWYLRSDIIWHKPNPMPESVTDRPTKAHEYIFLLSKNQRYFYDQEATKEPLATEPHSPGNKMHPDKISGPNDRNGHSQWETSMDKVWGNSGFRNKRTVWTVPSQPYPESHFATFPEDLIKPCILAGTSAKGCCPKCGAPWERVVENINYGKVDYNGKHLASDPTAAGRNILASVRAARLAGGPHDNPFPQSKTVGWQPTCDCFLSPENVNTVPCIVLDPFAGSGTTGQVALELGRKASLIELNSKYIELIKARTDVTPGFALA